MTEPSEITELTAAALTALLPEWRLALRAENKSPGTIEVYTDGTRRYLRWCESSEVAPMARTSLHTWMAQMLDSGAAPGTVRTRQLAVKRFSAWLIATEQLPTDPFLGIKGPAQRYPVVTPLSEDELRALIATCTTPTYRPGEPLHHRRDEAIIRLMLETGIRAGELIALHTDDLDLAAGRITIRFGKGGRGRVIPVGPATTQALQAYLVLRRDHPGAEESPLWLGARGTRFRYDGLGRALRRRAKLAGIDGFHPHKLRHTAAHRWLAKGGSESGLMAMAGWSRTDMLVRYTRATAGERAAVEARRLDLGNLGPTVADRAADGALATRPD
ncbi:MAG TPA: tyrosine-type recombinase/integrase [Nocardioides sp.]|nr:tyrosine-type recombinase/integrase [Nocardioides sp.]